MVGEYKIIFPGKPGKPWNSLKTFSLYRNFLIQKFQSNLLSNWILVQYNAQIGRRILNHFFWVSHANLQILKKNSPYIAISYKFVLKSVKSLIRIFCIMEYFFQGFLMPNLVDEYTIISLGKRSIPWKSPEIFSLYWSFLKICFEIYQKPQSILLNVRILLQSFIKPNLVDEYKTIVLGKRGKCLSSSKTYSLYWSFL